MIRVLSRTAGLVVVLVSLGAGLAPLGCKLATKDNPAVCVSDTDPYDHCAKDETCIDHMCRPKTGGGGESGRGGAMGSGGAGGRAALGSGGVAGAAAVGGAAGIGGVAGVGGAAGAAGTSAPDGGVMDGPIDQTQPTDASVDKPMCTATEASTCSKDKPFCSSDGRCVACLKNLDCPTVSAPACGADNTCGPCAAEADCAGRTMTPHCDMMTTHSCVACTTDAQCMTADKTKAVCNTANHVCVACLASKDCPDATPICDTTMHTCKACASDMECTARSTMTPPHCDIMGTKTCVECTTSAQCTADPKKPICVKNACAPCTSDMQCKDKSATGPGVCMFHQDGHCATDAETLYVQKPSAGCTGAGGPGTSASPFCVPQAAFDMAATMPAKTLIVLRGPTTLANVEAAPAHGTELSVIGQNNAQISPGANVGIHLVGDASLYVRGVTVLNGADIGIKAEQNTTLRMDRVYVYNNALGGLVLAKASFEIVNSIFDSNGPGVVGAAGFGGVYVGTPPTGKLARFNFNTVVNNKDKGMACESMSTSMGGLLLSGNATGVESVNCGIDMMTSQSGGTPMFQSGTNDYHLTKTSPCTDFAKGITPTPIDDYDGNARPSGAAADCGAYELVSTAP